MVAIVPARRRWIIALASGAAAFFAWRYADTHPDRIRRLVMPGPLSASHSFLASNCTACHTPGRGVQRTSCVSCHANGTRLLARQPTVFHATISACAGCHVEHDRARVRPVTMDHELLAALGSPPAGSASDSASPPPAAVAVRRDGLPYPLLRQGEERLDCASCHATKDPHRELFGRDCASCHATASWTIPGYRHPSPRSVDCVQCHLAPPSHFMMHFEMVSKVVARRRDATVAQCYACHQTTAWNDIVGVGWYKHH